MLRLVDNDVSRRILERFLTGVGCTYESASNGAEAVSLYRRKDTLFDAILMDLNMPVLGGEDATRQIREIERNESRRSFSSDAALSISCATPVSIGGAADLACMIHRRLPRETDAPVLSALL